jgi:hypothetical protein
MSLLTTEQAFHLANFSRCANIVQSKAQSQRKANSAALKNSKFNTPRIIRAQPSCIAKVLASSLRPRAVVQIVWLSSSSTFYLGRTHGMHAPGLLRRCHASVYIAAVKIAQSSSLHPLLVLIRLVSCRSEPKLIRLSFCAPLRHR